MSCREVVTLQLGHYANFVGSHWWNLQIPGLEQKSSNEINSNVLLRCDEGKGKCTYNPRLISVDRKGSLSGSHPHQVTDDETELSDQLWDGPVVKYVSDSCAGNSTSKAGASNGDSACGEKDGMARNEGTVWMDFLDARLHPKSVYTLSDVLHGDESQQFDVFSAGLELWTQSKIRDAIEDKLHFFVEECDHLQGFHVLFDLCNGFSGLSCGVLDVLADEFPSRGLLTANFIPPGITIDKDMRSLHYHLLTCGLALSHCASHSACLVIPLSVYEECWRHITSSRHFSSLQYDPTSRYQTSRVLASALDCLSLPYRVQQPDLSLYELTSNITSMGRSIGSVQLSLPFPVSDDSSLRHFLSTSPPLHQTDFMTPVTPYIPSHSHSLPFRQHISVRGVQQQSPHSVSQAISSYLQSKRSATNSDVTVVKDGFVLSPSLPVGMPSTAARKLKDEVKVAGLSALQSHPGTEFMLSSLVKEMERVSMGRHSHVFNSDEVLESMEQLRRLSACYRTSHNQALSDSDEDDDT